MTNTPEIKIKARRVVGDGDVTGKEITGKWGVELTDLAAPVYSPSTKRMYYIFGDTFELDPVDRCKEINWRGIVVGYSSSLDVSNGIQWDGFLDDESGKARSLIDCKYLGNNDMHYEISKTSQSGIEIDGAFYVFYESIRYWDIPEYWYVNFGSVLKSVDGGKTFERVNDLSWIEPTDPENGAIAKTLAEEGMDFSPSGHTVDLQEHLAPGFGQLFGADGKDGYIYLYGRYGGRMRGIRIARVKRKNFEIFAEYEYLLGYDEDGEGIWKKGRAGLDAMRNLGDKCEAIPGPTSNMSVFYNNYLQRWMLVYYKRTEGIYFATSLTPYGPFDTPREMLSIHDPGIKTNGYDLGHIHNLLYGAFCHEVLCREGGRIVPLFVSQWLDAPGEPRYNAARLFEIEFE